MTKLLPKIIFFALIIGIAIAGTVLYTKTRPMNEAKPLPASQAEVSPQTCIITIDGKKYDVSQLRFTHTGGDIFQCGTDMSAAFHRKHDDNLQMIQRYLVQ